MISLVRGYPKSLGRNFYQGSVWGGSFTAGKGLVLKDFQTDVVVQAHSRKDFLVQGEAFDAWQDKSVHNLQVEGVLYQSPIVNGQAMTGSGVSAKSGRHAGSLIAPPSLKIGSSWYCILNYGDIRVTSAGRPSNRAVRLQLEVMHAAGPPTSPYPLYANLGVVFQRKGSGLSIKWVYTSVDLADISAGGDTISTLHIRSAVESIFRSREYATPEDCYRDVDILQRFGDSISIVMDLARYSAIEHGAQPAYGSRVSLSSWANPPEPFNAIVNDVAELAEATRLSAISPRDRSLLAGDAVENLNDFSSNLIAYASDLRKTGDTVRSLLKLARNVKSPKAWAEAWLSYRYGDRLAIQDTRELLDAIAKRLGTRHACSLGRSSGSFEQTIEYHMRTYMVTTKVVDTIIAANDSYDGIMTAVSNLMRWDAWPTLENTWDLIPLSFLVDWVIPIQDLLAQIDDAVEAPYIKPLSQYVSERRVCVRNGPFGTSGLIQGSLECVYYKRIPRGILGDIRPFDVVADLPSFSVIHAGDALALTTTLRGHR